MHGIPCVQGYMGRRFEKALIDRLDMDLNRLALRKKMFVANRVKYIVLFKKRLGWDANDANNARYLKKFERIEAVYAAAYEKIFSDDQSSVFKVY
jgi:hypothetical protein